MKNNNIKEFPLKKNIVETKKLSKIEILKDNFWKSFKKIESNFTFDDIKNLFTNIENSQLSKQEKLNLIIQMIKLFNNNISEPSVLFIYMVKEPSDFDMFILKNYDIQKILKLFLKYI